MLIIELTRGSRWQEPEETIEHRECETESIEFAAARGFALADQYTEECTLPWCDALQGLGEAGAVIGGPPSCRSMKARISASTA